MDACYTYWGGALAASNKTVGCLLARTRPRSILWLGGVAIKLLLLRLLQVVVHLLLAVVVLLRLARGGMRSAGRTRGAATRHARASRAGAPAAERARARCELRTSSSGSSSSSATVAASSTAAGFDRPSRPTMGRSAL